jgi:hypothetical protein
LLADLGDPRSSIHIGSPSQSHSSQQGVTHSNP